MIRQTFALMLLVPLGVHAQPPALGSDSAAPPSQAGHPLSTASAQSTLERAVTAYASVKTMRGTFEQILTNPVFGSTVRAQGSFQQERPGRFSVQFTSPKEFASDRLVSDGTTLWVYVPSATPGTVYRNPLGLAAAGGVNLLEDLLTNPLARYTVGPVPGITARPGATGVLLRPLHGDGPFTQAIVWVDSSDAMVREFAVTEASGLARHIRLLTLQVNGPVDAAAFRFTPPSGVHIVNGPTGF